MIAKHVNGLQTHLAARLYAKKTLQMHENTPVEKRSVWVVFLL